MFDNTIKILDNAANVINCDPNVLARLKRPKKAVIVSVPVRMDDYRVKVFTGFRIPPLLALTRAVSATTKMYRYLKLPLSRHS